MENFNELFRAALKALTRSRGAKSNLVKDTGLASPFIYRMLKGSQYGSEATRRKIAEALGYSGSKYEEFLNVGRRELGLLAENEADLNKIKKEESDDDKTWKEKYLAKVEEHEATLRKLLAQAEEHEATLKAMKKEHDVTMKKLKAAEQKIADIEKKRIGSGGFGGKRREVKKKNTG